MATKDKKPRAFRNKESFEAEAAARQAVKPFLESRGFVVSNERIIRTGSAQQQIVEGLNPKGDARQIRVKLCWRRGHDRGPNDNKYSAAQVVSWVEPGRAGEAFAQLRAKDAKAGNTHMLLLQHDFAAAGAGPEGNFGVVYAALMPCEDVEAIWLEQHRIAAGLLAARALGRLKKNPVDNGDSPTLWLQEDRYPRGREYAEALWRWPSVEDLVSWPQVDSGARADRTVKPRDLIVPDDSWDDVPRPPVDIEDIGRDAADRRALGERSGVPRDPAVRRAVLERAKGACERPSCGAARDFAGFLDVHHILGVERSDRPWTCVALCPNCHREAHFSPRANEIRRELESVAIRYR